MVQLQPYIAAFPHECVGQLGSFGPTLSSLQIMEPFFVEGAVATAGARSPPPGPVEGVAGLGSDGGGGETTGRVAGVPAAGSRVRGKGR